MSDKIDTARAARDLKVNGMAAEAAAVAPRPGNEFTAPAVDPYGDTLALSIRAVLFDLVLAGMAFAAGDMRKGDRRLTEAHLKISSLRAARKNAPQSRRR